MAGGLPDVYLDGVREQLCESRRGAYCSSCGSRRVTALLVGSPEKGANRRWVVAELVAKACQAVPLDGYRTHNCGAQAARAA